MDIDETYTNSMVPKLAYCLAALIFSSGMLIWVAQIWIAKVTILMMIQAKKKYELSQLLADRGFRTACMRWYQYSPSSALSDTCNHSAAET